MIGLKRYVKVILIVLLLVGCVPMEDSSTPISATTNVFTANLLPIDLMPTRLTNIVTLNPTWHSRYVWAVHYSIENNNVFAVYGDDGSLVGWSLDTNNIFATHKLGIASPQAVQFSVDNKIVIGSTGSVYARSAYTDRPVEYLTGIAVWSTETGKMKQCLSNPCYEPPSENGEGEFGAIMDSTGRHVFLYDDFYISIFDLVGELPSQGILVNHPDLDYWWNIGRLAYDSFNQRYAVIYQEGRIELRNLIQKNNGLFNYITVMTEGNKEEILDIPAAMFDPTGNLLAFIRGNRVAIWEVGKHSSDLFFDDEMPNAFSLMFDQTGSLIFVAAKDKIIVLNVIQKNVIAEYSTPRITTFDISGDNRLLIWGDEGGNIYVWGIPKPK